MYLQEIVGCNHQPRHPFPNYLFCAMNSAVAIRVCAFFPFALFILSQLSSQSNLSSGVLSGFATTSSLTKSRRFARNLNFAELC